MMNAWLRGSLAKTITLENGDKVSVSIEDKLDEIMSILRMPSVNSIKLEAKQNGSEFIKCSAWPKGLVIVRDSLGLAKGMGFLTLLNGKHCIVTAAHVAILCKHGMILSAGLENKHVQISNDAETVFHGSMDAVAIAIPPNTAGLLGVGKAKIARTPATALPVTVYGYVKGEFVSALGLMGSSFSKFRFKHSVSTVAGFSGTPIYRDGMVTGIHLSSNGIGENFALSLDFVSHKLERNDYDGKRHLWEQEEYDDDASVYGNKSENDMEDYVDYYVEGEHYHARSAVASWMREQQTARDADYEHQRTMALSGLAWSDEKDDYGDLPRWEANWIIPRTVEEVVGLVANPVANFTAALSNGGSNFSNGTSTATKQSERTMSSTSDTSTSSIPEAKETPVAPRKKKSNRKKRSKTGNGPTVESKPSEVLLESTPVDSQKEPGNPTTIANSGLKPKSWTQAFTRRLKAHLGTGLGFDEAEKLARTEATEMFPRSQLTTSKESETLSKTTS
jgi:hypothetical protein